MTYLPGPPRPPSGQNQIRVVWGAMVTSTVVYLAVVWAALHARATADTLSPALHARSSAILGVLAVIAYFAAFLGTARLFRRGSHRNLMPLFVVRFALLEFICVCGLLAAMLTQEWRVYVPFHVLSLIGFMRAFPSTSRMLELTESADGT